MSSSSSTPPSLVSEVPTYVQRPYIQTFKNESAYNNWLENNSI